MFVDNKHAGNYPFCDTLAGDAMNCVTCREPMIVLEADKVELDYCLNCGGIWLDAGELELLLENKSKARRIFEKAAQGGIYNHADRRCPICDKDMEELKIGNERRAVMIDQCPERHGLWFDRGELREVIKYFETEESGVYRFLCKLFENSDKK